MPAADTSRFEEKVSQQGYSIFQRVLAPLEGLGDHEHPRHLAPEAAPVGDFS